MSCRRWIYTLLISSVCAAVAYANQNQPPAAGQPVPTNTMARTETFSAGPEPTVVTSERLQVDYAQNMGTFEGNVLAVDPRITVRADKMVVFFASTTNETRSLRRIFAEGAVVITVGERKSTSDQAEYTAEDGKVVLTGNPRVQSPDGTVSGERITFWHGQERMDIESATRLIIYPEEMKKQSESQGSQPR